jgi:tRNA-modifying protein YgfZ
MATTDTSSLAEEYRILTRGCGLVDRSERGKLALTGTDATEFLNGQVTNDVARPGSGEGCYAAFLTHKGKMLGDLRILVTDSELLLDSERSALQALFDMIRRFKVGYDVELHKRTLESALFSLIGPGADEVVGRATGTGSPPQATAEHERGATGDGSSAETSAEPKLQAEEHSHAVAHMDGTPVRLIRTDAGIDVLCDSAASPKVREALEAAGASPASEAAAEIVRVERGRPRYGIDIDDATIPQEAGLNERAVSFTKGCYVGQETVARLHYRGKPNRLLRGLRLSEPLPAGAALRLGEREVGRLTSSMLSPTLGPIGLALVRVQAEPGSTLAAGEEGASALVTELPFSGQ